jgi:hypothetical protein
MLQKKEAQLAKLKDLSAIPPISLSLDKLSSLRSKGLWFEGLDVDYRDAKYSISLTGFVFLGDAYNERSAVDAFVANIKNDEAIKTNFSNIEIVSLERRTLNDYTVTYFLIRLN